MNLKKLENSELDKLKMKILENLPTSLQDFKKYSTREAFSLIGMKHNLILKETKQHWDALETGLTKIGIDPMDFLKKMDESINKSH